MLIPLLAATLGLGTPPAAPPRLPVSLAVVPIDAATHGQSRAVEHLVAAASEPQAWFEAAPWAAPDPQTCAPRRRDAAAVAACLRPVLAAAWAGGVRPAHVALVVEPADEDQARVTCIGVGAAPEAAERQTIVVAENAFFTRGDTRWRTDLNALAGCIAAAGSESGW
jgi:hypothetical protein